MKLTAQNAQAMIASLKQMAIEVGGVGKQSCDALGLTTEGQDIEDAALGTANNLQHLEDIVEDEASFDPGGPTGELYPTVPANVPAMPRKPFLSFGMQLLATLQAQLPALEELTITYGTGQESVLNGMTEYDDHYADAVVQLGLLVTAMQAQRVVLEAYTIKSLG